MKKRKAVLFVAVILLSSVTGCVLEPSSVTSTNGTQYATKKNMVFEEFLDNLFITLLTDNALDVNFLLKNPETYGLQDERFLGYSKSLRKHNESITFTKAVIKELETFDVTTFTKEQANDYAVVLDSFQRDLLMKDYYYYDRPLGSYLGYQAQLPLILAEYRFDDKTDIENYFTIITSTQKTFDSFITYEKEKLDTHPRMSKVMMEGVIEQCENFIGGSENNYLITVFNDKVDTLDFLTSVERVNYKMENKTLINTALIPAYTSLKESLGQMIAIGDYSSHLGLTLFENGASYYEALFQQTIGIDRSISEISSLLQNYINHLIYVLSTSSMGGYYSQYDQAKTITKDEVLPFIQSHMENDFPALQNTDFTLEIKEIHPSLQENSSPAMYFLSPIDTFDQEVIYINPLSIEQANPEYYFYTLSHESYPGHLYQHVYFKELDHHPIRHLINYTGYSEGWATYVENYMVRYTNTEPSARDYQLDLQLFNNLIMVQCDIGVNYELWDENRLYDYLRTYYRVTIDDIQPIYNQLIEAPVNVSQYYYSYFEFFLLQQEAEKMLGDAYSDKAFHTYILESGPSSFTYLRDHLKTIA